MLQIVNENAMLLTLKTYIDYITLGIEMYGNNENYIRRL